MEERALENSRRLAEIELVKVNQNLKELAENGKMLEIRKSSKTDEEFLEALAKAANTSKEIIDWVSMYTLLPIASWGYAADFDYSSIMQEDVC